MSTCRRQLSTFACSSRGVSVICGIGVEASSSGPRRSLSKEVCLCGILLLPGSARSKRGRSGLGFVAERFEAALQLVQPRAQDGAFGFGICGKALHLRAELELCVADPLLQRGGELVLLLLER